MVETKNGVLKFEKKGLWLKRENIYNLRVRSKRPKDISSEWF